MINKIILEHIWAYCSLSRQFLLRLSTLHETLADNLSHPWGLAVIDENNILFTELSGQLRKLKSAVLNQKPITGVLLKFYSQDREDSQE